jgi:hypothetical protein
LFFVSAAQRGLTSAAGRRKNEIGFLARNARNGCIRREAN